MSEQVPASHSNSLLREALRLGWGGAKANLTAAVVLWLTGLLIVVSYYGVPTVRGFFDGVGAFKLATSPWFAIASTGFFGAFIPYLFQVFFLEEKGRQPLRKVMVLGVFWAIHGWQVDSLYRLQAFVFGADSAPLTLLKKLFVDQFLWGPFFAIPQVLLAYLWVESDFSLARTRDALRRKSYLARAIPLQIASWSVWFPAVLLIYLLPLPLQLPLQNLILAMWSLILIFFAKHS